ncbi:predicted protein [Histoplasma capsulatum var. duboisii H88]|uniref:Predicted protein n=1 Tax=Ajellomyces capsulatus (strain H88) TaxID=544711 RepID=F0U6V3_AJEC8|nr:predicted protein [Histoplasma capsulatum var. duboisii H88]
MYSQEGDYLIWQLEKLPTFRMRLGIRVDPSQFLLLTRPKGTTSSGTKGAFLQREQKAVGKFFLLLISREHATNMHHAAVRFSSFPSSLPRMRSPKPLHRVHEFPPARLE